MSRIRCTVGYVELENREGRLIKSVEVTCGKCGHSAEAWGQHQASIDRCLATLAEECPEGENNYYEES